MSVKNYFVKMTATTAVSEKETGKQTATAFLLTTFYPAVKKDLLSVSVPLYCKVEKTRGTQMRKSVRLFLLLKNAFRNVPSRYRLEKNQKKAIRLISMPVQNAICFAMRQPNLNIIRNYTLTA